MPYHRQSASPRRMQSQVFQTVRRKDAGIAPAKDYLHHESKKKKKKKGAWVCVCSSPFYYSDICRMLVDIVPMRMYTLVGEIAYDNTY